MPVREQRGARDNCSGTDDNLLIDRMVCEDAQGEKRNLSMAWIDVAKAYDSVDHGWLSEMFTLHGLPKWFAKVMEKLANSWNARIVAQTTQRKEISPTIRFKKGLPQGDVLCPMLFILCLNPIAWKVRVTKEYRQAYINQLYIDDIKLFAASETSHDSRKEWNGKHRFEVERQEEYSDTPEEGTSRARKWRYEDS